MSNLAMSGKMEISTYDNAISIVLDDDACFNNVAFKVLQNREKYGLIKCGKLSQNGKIKLVYDSGKYKSLENAARQLKPKEFLTVASNIRDTVEKISENGFVKLENVLTDANAVFVDMNDLSAHMICVPLASGCELKESGEAAIRELSGSVCREAEKVFGLNVNDVAAFFPDGGSSPLPKPEIPVIPDEKPVKETETDEPEQMAAFDESKRITFPFWVIGALSAVIGASIAVTNDRALGVIIMVTGCLISAALNLIYGGEGKESKTAQSITLVSVNTKDRIKLCVDKPVYYIGRQAGHVDGLIENERTVGRMHCRITQEQGFFSIQDLSSTNGTYVNGRSVTGEQKIRIEKGDIIKIAKIEFVVK